MTVYPWFGQSIPTTLSVLKIGSVILLENDSRPAVVFPELPANYSKNTYPFTEINDADSYLTTTEIWQNYYNDEEQ